MILTFAALLKACTYLSHAFLQMALYIHCGFTRVSVREVLQMHSSANGKHNVTEDIIHEYNSQFEGYSRMRLGGSPAYMLKKCKEVNSIFSHPRNGILKKCSINTLPLSLTKAGKSYLPLKSSNTPSLSVTHVLASFLH